METWKSIYLCLRQEYIDGKMEISLSLLKSGVYRWKDGNQFISA